MSRHTRHVLVVVVGALASLLAAEGAAEAYPQWQLSTGAVRCNECHFSPAGGGLINSYGREVIGDELSTFGGNGAFLHGVPLPRWLAIGGDLRWAFLAQDVQDPNGTKLATFPMQADLTARVAFGAGISAIAIGGLRGKARDEEELVPYQNYQPISTSRLISREHYLMWQPSPTGAYVRAGRFFAPFGLRLAEHFLYIRRDQGYDTLRETYNLSGGYVQNQWELHVTAFAHDFVRHIGSDQNGGAAYLERRLLNDTLALGGQARFSDGPGMKRFAFGAVGKAYVARLRTLFLAEANGVGLFFDDPVVSARMQVVAAAGVAILPVRGVTVTLLGERNQVDVAAPSSWTAATGLVSWFPYAHFELQLLGRLQHPSNARTAKTLFLQIHYFL